MQKKIKEISVHELVDFLLRVGDIDDRVFNVETMTRGSKIHAHYQAKQDASYVSEYFLKETFDYKDFSLTLRGYADGVILNKKHPTVEEIKSTNDDLFHFHEVNENWHLGQAQCYALMLAHEQDFSHVHIRLVYISQVNTDKITFNYDYSVTELEDIVYKYIKEYLDFFNHIYLHEKERNESVKSLNFPYEYLRTGQEIMIKEVEKTLKTGGVSLIEAPTGIGKTMAALYPSIKSFKDGITNKIFYLTSKGSTQKAAYDALRTLIDQKLKIKAMLITAKEKMCINDVIMCNPDGCPYTKNYYEKLKDILLEMFLNESLFNNNVILKYALKHQVCPFELELDLSLFMDVIVGDYNYVFDPTAYLKRYFDEVTENYVFLIDEAHNLIERVRSNYSIILDFYPFIILKKELRKIKARSLKQKINAVLKEVSRLEENKENIDINDENETYKLDELLLKFVDSASLFMKEYPHFKNDTLKPLFFDVRTYLKLNDLKNSSIMKKTLLFSDDKTLKIRILCLNPKPFITSGIAKSYASILFSGTLGPKEFYENMLLNSEDSSSLTIKSPFDKRKLQLLVATDIATTYKKREGTYGEVVDYILSAVRAEVGNYLVFCPSYEYLEKIASYLETLDDFILLKQEKVMNDKDRIIFLSQFKENPTNTTIGLTVMGGIFAEGIDLPQDRLRGVIIIGVGFPRLDDEVKEIHDYYETNFDRRTAFYYAYVYPGINRVLQAMGRVIRSEEDHGFILLIDKRYLERPYINFIRDYNAVLTFVNNPTEVQNILKFYKENMKN
jgi:Rad3-related DNA helicase